MAVKYPTVQHKSAFNIIYLSFSVIDFSFQSLNACKFADQTKCPIDTYLSIFNQFLYHSDTIKGNY